MLLVSCVPACSNSLARSSTPDRELAWIGLLVGSHTQGTQGTTLVSTQSNLLLALRSPEFVAAPGDTASCQVVKALLLLVRELQQPVFHCSRAWRRSHSCRGLPYIFGQHVNSINRAIGLCSASAMPARPGRDPAIRPYQLLGTRPKVDTVMTVFLAVFLARILKTRL